jgi:hypothetical protein
VTTKAGALGALAILAVACGGHEDARFPPRPAGCEVKLFHAAPEVRTENIGPVRMKCDPDVSKSDCLRSLEDYACGMGADVVWGLGDEPELKNGKNVWTGRAAHTALAKDAGADAR